MSLFNNASCGPSTNVVSKLSSSVHNSQRSNLPYQPQGPPQEQQFFSSSNKNRLNYEFDTFAATGIPSSSQISATQMNSIPKQRISQNNNINNQWINDFSNINLNQNLSQSTNHQPSMIQNNSQHFNQPSLISHNFQQQSMMQQQNMILQEQFMQSSIANKQLNQEPIPFNMTEHNQIHHHQYNNFIDEKMNDDDLFEAAFSNIEEELNINEDFNHHDNENLAKIAKNISDKMESVNDEDQVSSKFQNSNFLKLMKSLSSKNVVLSNEGNRFLNKIDGENYFGKEVDEIILNAPKNDLIAQKDKNDIVNKLEDPLNYLNKNDDLVNNNSEEIRKIINDRINGNHILPRSRSEIFDDYSHEDDRI